MIINKKETGEFIDNIPTPIAIKEIPGTKSSKITIDINVTMDNRHCANTCSHYQKKYSDDRGMWEWDKDSPHNGFGSGGIRYMNGAAEPRCRVFQTFLKYDRYSNFSPVRCRQCFDSEKHDD